MHLTNRKKIVKELLSQVKIQEKTIKILLKDEDAWGKERPYFDDVSKKYLSEEEVKELEETYRVIIFKTLTEEDIKRIRAERGTE